MQLLIGHNHHFCIGVIQDVFVFFLIHGGVDRDMDHTGQRHTHIHEIPLGSVVCYCNYFIPLFVAHL